MAGCRVRCVHLRASLPHAILAQVGAALPASSIAQHLPDVCSVASKRWLIVNAGGYDGLTYRPRGRSWFVLSGYRGDQIYYESGGRVVNVFAMAYPIAQRQLFDPVVERMEDSFRPGGRRA